MARLRFTTTWLISLLLLAGCASADVTSRRETSSEQMIDRPARIIVHDFAASPSDLPPNSAVAQLYSGRSTPQSADEIRLGRELGHQVASELVKEILNMGLPAERAGAGPPASVGNLLIGGEFISIDEGSRVKRMLIGFGAGASELKTLVEGYLVTKDGLEPLGSAEIKAAGGKMPGMLVPVVGGAIAGEAGRSAVISGSMNVVQELGPESMNAAAKRTAREIAKGLQNAFRRRGWI